jgi:thioredoxin 1
MRFLSSAPRRLAVVAIALVLWSTSLAAQEKEAFTSARFADLQEAGALILLDVYADWCPTCARQQAILAEFRTSHPEIALHTLVIDFDGQKEYVRQFRAPRQSTLILYRGPERLWFSVAQTNRDAIFTALLAGASGQGTQ